MDPDPDDEFFQAFKAGAQAGANLEAAGYSTTDVRLWVEYQEWLEE